MTAEYISKLIEDANSAYGSCTLVFFVSHAAVSAYQAESFVYNAVRNGKTCFDIAEVVEDTLVLSGIFEGCNDKNKFFTFNRSEHINIANITRIKVEIE